MWLMMADFSGDPGLRMETWKGAVVDSSLGLDPEPPPPHFDGDRIVRQGLGCPCGVCAGDAGFSPGVETGWMVSLKRLNYFLELFQKHGGSGGELAFMSRGLGTCCTLLRARAACGREVQEPRSLPGRGSVCSRSGCSAKAGEAMVFCGVFTVWAGGSSAVLTGAGWWAGCRARGRRGSHMTAVVQGVVRPWPWPPSTTACLYVADQKRLSSACF